MKGSGAVIRLDISYRQDKNKNFILNTLDFILDLEFLNSIINSLFEPTKESYEVLNIVNKFLKMIGIDKDWKAVLDEIEY